jgi:phosphoenolpyruvate-protein kinase (PTS system EI component)
MTPAPVHINGLPYVPGLAQGTLKQAPEQAGPDDILMLSQTDIGPLATQPAGFVVVEGAPLSHTMIALHGNGVPTVILSAVQAARLEAGRQVRLDGYTGLVTTEVADPAALPAAIPAPAAGQPVFSADGVAVELRASVRSAGAASQALAAGAQAIGLVRTEFLLPEAGAVPNEEFYRHAFSELCRAAAPLPVTIRLLDLASDKMPGWAPTVDAANTALGLQGVRLFALEPVRRVLDAQLAAFAAVSDAFDVRLQFPYPVRLEEVRYWCDYIRQSVSRPVPVGAMVETPAGMLDLANWLAVADFVSIGCNDLMQCLFAADRDRPELRAYLDPYAPPLYRLFKQAAESAANDLQRIQLCGLLPQMPVRTTGIDAAQRLAAQVCSARESRQVAEILGLQAAQHRPFLAP